MVHSAILVNYILTITYVRSRQKVAIHKGKKVRTRDLGVVALGSAVFNDVVDIVCRPHTKEPHDHVRTSLPVRRCRQVEWHQWT